MADRNALTVTWRDGREEQILAGADETVLEEAEVAGVDLPAGCRAGACGSCTARVLCGDVAHARPPLALKPRHRDVLCCLARPRADCSIEVGAAVRRELVTNPWPKPTR